MSYFGTSGPPSRVAHSIGAGYQRRSNQIAARKTAPYLGNIGGVADNAMKQLNTSYGRSIGNVNPFQYKISKYGNPKSLRDSADEFTKWYDNKHAILETNLQASKKVRKQTELNEKFVKRIHSDISAELSKADPIDINTAVIANKMVEAKTIYPDYNYADWPSIQVRLSNATTATIKQENEDQENFDKSQANMNETMIKGMEEWFVEGGLVRESKARVWTTGSLVVGAVGAILVWRWLFPAKVTFGGGNKSAAMAVFK